MGMLPTVNDLSCGKGRTKQKTGVEHDINKLVARYQRTGELPAMRDDHGIFLDVARVGDFQACQQRIVAAREAFESLPSDIRRKFGNSPEAYLTYVHALKTPQQLKEAADMGMVILPEEKKPLEPMKVIVIPDEKKAGGQ